MFVNIFVNIFVNLNFFIMKKTLITSLLVLFCIASFSTPLLAQYSLKARLDYCSTSYKIMQNNELSEAAIEGASIGWAIANCKEFSGSVLENH